MNDFSISEQVCENCDHLEVIIDYEESNHTFFCLKHHERTAPSDTCYDFKCEDEV
jgi:transcription initiation factor IIE alpha subunit